MILYGSTQAMSAIDDDWEVMLNPAQALPALLVSLARVPWCSEVIEMGLLCANDGGPGRTSCPLASQQSSMMTMGGHQLCQSTVGTCTTPGKASAGRYVKT
jgi:hypothetical protein